MFALSVTELESLVGQFLWPLFRISGFFMVAPIIGANVVPARIRIMLAFVVTMLVAPNLSGLPGFSGLSAAAFLVIAQQILIGALLGFLFQIFFQIFILTGQMIAMKMGLGFASMVDPTNGVSVAVVSQFYLIAVTLLFVTTNGHLVMIEIMVDSFRTIPVGSGGIAPENMWQLINWGTWMFASSLLLALPALTALLIVNFSFGVMSRAAPQLNIFSLGFPISLITGLFLLWLSSTTLSPHYENLVSQTFEKMNILISP